MAVAFDAVGPSSAGASATAASSLSWTHVNGAGANAITAGCTIGKNPDTGLSLSATYATVAMAASPVVHCGTFTSGALQVFTLANPAAGSNSVVCTLSSGTATLVGGSISATGVGGFAPFYTGSGNATPATATSSGSTTGGLIAAYVANANGITATTAPSTSRFVNNLDTSTSADNAAGATSPSTGSNVTTAWDVTFEWAVIGAEMLPAASTTPAASPGRTWNRRFRRQQKLPLFDGGVPQVVQASAPVHLTSLTGPVNVTMPAATGAGNTLIVCAGSNGTVTANPHVSGITLGGLPDNWQPVVVLTSTSRNDSEIWYDPNCAGGQTAVAVTFAGGGGTGDLYVTVYEVAGILTTDQTSTGEASGAAWSSGTTPTLAGRVPEIFFGNVITQTSGGPCAITGVGAYVYQQLDVSPYVQTCGYQRSYAPTATFSGTQASGNYTAVAAAFFTASPAVPPPAVGTAAPGKTWNRRFHHRQTPPLIAGAVTAQQAGPPVYPWHGPIRSAIGQPTRGGSVAGTHAGVYAQQGPPARVWDGPVTAAQPRVQPPRGRVTRNAGTYAQAGPAARMWDGPVRAPIPAPQRGGQVASRDGVYAQAGPAVRQLQSPVRARVPQPVRGGQVARRAGVYGQAGPPARMWDGPVVSTGRGLPPQGRTDSRAGVYAQAGPHPDLRGRAYSRTGVFTSVATGAGPPIYPLGHPVTAKRQPAQGGRSTSRTGAFAQSGPAVRVWDGPVAAAQARLLPPRGRIASSRGVYAQSGPAVRVWDGPVRAPVPAPRRGGAVASRSGVYGQAGPAVHVWHAPAQARPPLPPAGRSAWRSGVYTFIPTGSGPPIYPLGHPVTAKRSPLPQGGHVSSRAGVYGQAGPPARMWDGPVRAQPGPQRGGRIASRAGVFTPPPPVAAPALPLHAPVQAKRQPTPGGRVIRRAGTYAQAGPPVRIWDGPIGLGRQQPPPPTRGRAASQRGPYGQTGPPVRALQRPVRARWQPVYLTGRRRTTLLPPFATPPPALVPAYGTATVTDPRDGTVTVRDPRDGTAAQAAGRGGSAVVVDQAESSYYTSDYGDTYPVDTSPEQATVSDKRDGTAGVS